VDQIGKGQSAFLSFDLWLFGLCILMKITKIKQKGMTFDYDFGYYFPLSLPSLKERIREGE
jgi:hypothetical protein